MELVSVVRVDGLHPDFILLTTQLSALLAELNGDEDAFYAPLNSSDAIKQAVVAYANGRPVGCGAFRQISPGVVEIKRMFVEPGVRGKGVGRSVLAELETWAKDSGSIEAVLETSRRLDAALGLYAGFGYQLIPNYEPYQCAADSVCFRKVL